jgi:hypothetical protein
LSHIDKSLEETGTFIHCWWKYKMQTTLGSILAVPAVYNIVTIGPRSTHPKEKKRCAYSKVGP